MKKKMKKMKKKEKKTKCNRILRNLYLVKLND